MCDWKWKKKFLKEFPQNNPYMADQIAAGLLSTKHLIPCTEHVHIGLLSIS